MSKLSEIPLSATASAQPEYSPQERRLLLRVARQSIVSAFAHRTAHEADAQGEQSFSPHLSEPRGVFTTLYSHGALRGCVGFTHAAWPLHRAVAESARSAAFEDTRFWPVSEAEVPALEISLSILSRLFPITAAQVEVGRHGLVISDGIRRGLLLPQVPVEHAWDRETFLDQTCLKAGLRPGAWQKVEATLEAFTAEVFGDGDATAG